MVLDPILHANLLAKPLCKGLDAYQLARWKANLQAGYDAAKEIHERQKSPEWLDLPLCQTKELHEQLEALEDVLDKVLQEYMKTILG